MTLFDAAIVGGGPAGCSAAITLAQQGARVILVEAKAYPHHKVCGEFLSPECAYWLDQLGVTGAIYGLNPVAIEVARVTAPGGIIWETPLPGTALGLSRSALDNSLAHHARSSGVEVREGSVVTAISGNLRTGFHLEVRLPSGSQQVRAHTVIGAHGKRSNVDRALKRKFMRQPQPFIALKAHFHGPPPPGRIELHTFPGGYCGMSEIEDGLTNVCLLAHSAVFKNGINACVEWMQSQNSHLRRWLSQAQSVTGWLSIAQVPFVKKDIVIGDILLAGDAAGLIVPLAGDGIAMALHGGRLAAVNMTRFLAGDIAAEELKQEYISNWERHFNSRLRLGRLLQTIMLRPRLLALGLHLLSALPPLGEYLVQHTRDSRLIRKYS